MSNHSYDSSLHRLNRSSAMIALSELEDGGLAKDFVTGKPNPDVDAILQRMVATALGLPKVSQLNASTAATYLPELSEVIPEHLRGYIAKSMRYDDDVPGDCAKIAALGEHCVDGVPLADFPKYILLFSGRVAFYRFCSQHLPGEEDVLLRHCCLRQSDVTSARTWLGHRDPAASAEIIFRIACQEQNQPRKALTCRAPSDHTVR